MHGYSYANNNPLTYSDPAGTEIGSKPNSCQYDLSKCSKETKKQFTDDFWYNPVYESADEGTACYGREGCARAYEYVLHGGKDVEKAKEIAATYCVYNAEECSDKAAAVARGKWIEDAVDTALLAYLGGAAGAENPCNSFIPGTQVLMADGTTKPIEDVKTGDKVLATDPETGRTEVKTVTAEITGKGLKNLVRITLSIEVDGKKKTASVTATAGHPFWVPELGAWVDATQLTVGERLDTSTDAVVHITDVDRWTQPATVHNLTVADIHTYYVVAGATPVLVHNSGNCNSITRAQSDDIADYLGYKKTKMKSAGGAPIWENKKAAGGQPRYITYDRTGHNKEAIFKGASFRNPFQSTKDSARDGTYGLDISPKGLVQGLKWLAK